MIKLSGYFDFFGHRVSPYIFCAFVGLYFAMVLSVVLAKQRNISASFIFRMITSVVFIGIISEIFVGNIPRFMLSFAYLLGLCLACFLFWIISKIFRKNTSDVMEIGIIATNGYMAFSKLGCFFTGCCHGTESDGIFTVIYAAKDNYITNGNPLFPIQLIEVLVRVIVLIVMILLFQNKKWTGYRIPLYISFMGISYFWAMPFWDKSVQLVNQYGINFIGIFILLFLVSLTLSLFFPLRNMIKNGTN